MATSAESGPRTYGNFTPRRTKGLLGLSTVETLAAAIVAVIVLIAIIGNKWIFAGLVLLVGIVAVSLSVIKDKHGMSMRQRIGRRLGWWEDRLIRGRNSYRSGPVSQIPWGETRLPGVLAKSSVAEFHDGLGRPFALVEHTQPKDRAYTVILTSEPIGGSQVDEHQKDLWVARFGQFLAGLCDEPELQMAAITVETTPDTGYRMSRVVHDRMDDNSPEFARRVLEDTVEMSPTGSSVTRAYVALTFSAKTTYGSRMRTRDEVGTAIATKLPGLIEQISQTGAGNAEPLGLQPLCELARCCYDPAVASLFDRAHAEGKVPRLRWQDVGPAATDKSWDYLRHDSAVSRTWSMTVPPRMNIQSSVLRNLLDPKDNLLRKRVTMLYRPISPARSASVVDADLNTARFNSSTKKRSTARDDRQMAAAELIAQEEAEGAGLTNFGMVITATVGSEDELADANAMIENLAAGARIRIRPSYGAQDSAFAVGLPLGIVPWKYLKTAEVIQEHS
jgi:hypothetical protein